MLGLDDNEWAALSALGNKCQIYISYTTPGVKGPPPPSTDEEARRRYFSRLGPPRSAEMIVGATTFATFINHPDYILVKMDEALMISYGSGPTCPRKEFVLLRYTDDQDEGGMGFLSDDGSEVLRWDACEPTWCLIR